MKKQLHRLRIAANVIGWLITIAVIPTSIAALNDPSGVLVVVAGAVMPAVGPVLALIGN